MNKVLCLLAAALLSVTAEARTSLWQVSKGAQTLYLGGTIHVLSKSDLPLPASFQKAFDNTDVLVLETDIKELMNPDNSLRMLTALTYADGRTLKDVVQPATYQAVVDYAQAESVPVNVFERMTPAGVALTVLSIELAKAGIQQEGVDKIFHNQAVLDGRPVLGLESVDQHLSYVTGMGQGAEDDFILQTLEDARKTHESLRKIINAWRIGDQPALEAEVIDNMPQDYPQLYARLLVERNNNWMPQIIQMLDTPEQELVLVGAAHLVGLDGLLAQLLEKGYQIKQLP